MNADLRRKLLRTPYELGGRQIGAGIDCLGVVLFVLEQRGEGIPDPWETLARHYREPGQSPGDAGFPEGWRRGDPPFRDGDVLLFFGEHHWSAIVHDGFVWSSHPSPGTWSRPLNRFSKTPQEVWRRC
jgi:hypothetical protein